MTSQDESFVHCEKSASEFLSRLENYSCEEVLYLTTRLSDDELHAHLMDVELLFIHDEPSREIISENFLRFLSEVLVWERLAPMPELLYRARSIVRILNVHKPRCIVFLCVNAEFDKKLLEIIKKEVETGSMISYVSEDGASTTACHVMADLFPSYDIKGLSQTGREMLLTGSRLQENDVERFVTNDKIVINNCLAIFHICRNNPQCEINCHFLFVKMISWYLGELEFNPLAPLSEVIEYMKVLVASASEDKVKIGLWLAHVLVRFDISSLLEAQFHLTLIAILPRVSEMMSSGDFVWIEEIYASLVLHVASGYDNHLTERLPVGIEAEKRVRNVCLMMDISLSALSNVNANSAMLGNLGAPSLRTVLSDEGESAAQAWREKFSELVTYVVETVDAMQVERGFFECVPDMLDEEDFSEKFASVDVCLNEAVSLSLLRATGASKSPFELESNVFVKVLRYLSVLHAVNEDWRIMYGIGDPVPLVQRSLFNSPILTSFVLTKMEENFTKKLCMQNKQLCKIARQYSFLLPVSSRLFIFNRRAIEKLQMSGRQMARFEVPRQEKLEFVARHLIHLKKKKNSCWEFKFVGELAIGAGPTKEFYAEFSHECHRHDLGVWIGEPGEEIAGKRYTTSELGLFPSPEAIHNKETERCLVAMGTIMAKSLLDAVQMNLNLCDAFYCVAFRSLDGSQRLSVHDLRHVVPGVYKFVLQICETLKHKKNIEADENLSTETKAEAISRITCGGSSFEDLCIDFTVPGFPSIEMVPGGRNIFLNVENMEQYLKLVIWWLLYEGPIKKFDLIREGFASIAPIKCLRMFYPHEFQALFGGTDAEEWTSKVLERCCTLQDGFTVNTPVVRHLFHVIPSLNSEERKGFLRFVTGTPKLPVGGLHGLRPRLTVCSQNSYDNPDGCLPMARTCFNALFIPPYSCKEVLREKLMLAVMEGLSRFDFV